jgi:short-subunit dehydrogenase
VSSTVLITGATTGIGYELGKLFAADGCDLILVARNSARLQDLAREWSDRYHIVVHPIPADLSLPSASVRLHDEIRTLGCEVSVLVNNAGFGTFAPFAEADTDEQIRMIQLNIGSLVHLTRLFLPAMVARKQGRILNVASTAAFQPGPFMAVYYASKAFVLSFSEALWEELRGTGVTVTALCPGPTPTNFQARSGMENVFLTKGIIPLTDAAFVARAGYRAMSKGRRVVIPGLFNRLGAHGVRFLPKFLVLKILRQLHVFA